MNCDRRHRYELHVTSTRGDFSEVHRFRTVAEAQTFARRFMTTDKDKRGRPLPRMFHLEIRDRRRHPQKEADPSNVVWSYP